MKEALSGIGGILRPRREAVNWYPEYLHEGDRAWPPYTPFLPPKLGRASWAIQDPAPKQAAEAETGRQRRNAAQTSSLDTGQIGAAFLRCIFAGERAGDWNKFGGLGGMRTNLAHLPEPVVIQNMETASRFEKAQNAASAHLIREGGTCS